MAIYSWFTHERWLFSIVMLVYQRVSFFGPWYINPDVAWGEVFSKPFHRDCQHRHREECLTPGWSCRLSWGHVKKGVFLKVGGSPKPWVSILKWSNLDDLTIWGNPNFKKPPDVRDTLHYKVSSFCTLLFHGSSMFGKDYTGLHVEIAQIITSPPQPLCTWRVRRAHGPYTSTGLELAFSASREAARSSTEPALLPPCCQNPPSILLG